MIWFTALALAGTDVPAAHFVTRDAPTRLCVSSIPAAGKLPKAARAPYAAALDALDRTPDAAGRAAWWQAEGPALLTALDGHPAGEALSATVGALVDPDAAPGALALAAAHPDDLCLATTAAVLAWEAHDAEQARTYVGRAWIGLPSPDLAFVLGEIVVEAQESDRLDAVLARGLALDPAHPGLRRLRAVQAILRGEGGDEDLAFLHARGDHSLDPMVLEARWKQGRIDDYLRVAAGMPLPLGIAPGLATAPKPLQALLDALGAEGGLVPVVLETSEGDLPCTLYAADAPLTVASFVGLATGRQAWTDPRTEQAGVGPLYQDVTFHRVIPGFMIQGGDPLGTGTGGPGYAFPDEVRSQLRFDRAGRLAMANSGPDTNGSQFFVTDAPTAHLDGRHTIFGQCDAPTLVTRIANLPRDEQDRPNTPVTLRQVRIDGLPAAPAPAAPPAAPPG